ncbi:MAG: hypothetical protein M1832_006381, partial [Thelocarpon impressellum]
ASPGEGWEGAAAAAAAPQAGAAQGGGARGGRRRRRAELGQHAGQRRLARGRRHDGRGGAARLGADDAGGRGGATDAAHVRDGGVGRGRRMV